MSTDLSGGLDPDFEYFRAERPEDLGMRDSATLWILDETGTLALPRVTFDAIGESWDRPWVQLNFAHRDGRRLRVWSQQPGHLAFGPDGKTAARGAGPLQFRCVEPFRRWTIAFEGEARQSSVVAQMAGERDGDPVALAFRFEAEMAAAPWLMGGMTAKRAADDDGKALMGGVRYEQLCRIEGTIDLAGEQYRIAGTGMRVRRQGVRKMGTALGHLQHSALFPSGRAFGVNAFAPGPNGVSPFNEGFLLMENGRRIGARLARGPWMKRLVETGDDASLVLETEGGLVRIEGETLLTVFDHHLFEMADNSILAPGTARYVWDGEEAIGLIERCTLRAEMER